MKSSQNKEREDQLAIDHHSLMTSLNRQKEREVVAHVAAENYDDYEITYIILAK